MGHLNLEANLKLKQLVNFGFASDTGDTMSEFDTLMEKYKSENERLKLGLSDDLLTKVAKGLGPSIYNKDSSLVSGGDPKELETVKKNYLIKKLGLEDSDELDTAIAAVIEKLGSSNRNKYRVLFYALLCKNFNKEAVYA